MLSFESLENGDEQVCAFTQRISMGFGITKELYKKKRYLNLIDLYKQSIDITGQKNKKKNGL